MSKKMKIGIWIVVGCLIIGLLVYMVPKISLWYQLYQINLHWYDIENFSQYQEDFQEIANLTKEFFENNPIGQTDDYREKYVHIGYHSATQTASMVFYRHTSETESHAFPLSEEQQKSIGVICSLPNQEEGFTLIRYYDNQITFQMDMNHAYAIVYTFDGEKPSYMTRQNMGDRIGVERIDDHWYHVITKGGLLF